jgi:hypothetical protein
MVRTLLIGAMAALVTAGCALAPTAQQATEARVAANEPCMKTGSRIAVKDGDCSPHPGRTYSREELDRTGAFDVAEALQRLDPAIR